MFLRAILVALLVALSACVAADDDGDDEAVASDEADLVSINPTRPIALHYGLLQRRPDVTNQPDGAATARLRARNVENVLVTSQLPTQPEARAWGGKLASHLPARVIDDPSRTDTLLAHIGDIPALIRERIAAGYAYVAIDELEPAKASFLRDSDPRSDVFVSALRTMNADPTLRQRIILYVNAYNMAGPNFSDFTQFGKVLRACRDYCRVVGAEMYLGTGEAFVRGAAVARTATQKGGCASGVDCMGFVVNKMEQVAPGIRSRTITVLGVDSHYLKAADPDSYCTGRGALRAEMAKIRLLGQPGIGTYSLARVASDVSLVEFPSKQAAFASCMRAIIQTTSFPGFPAPTP